jgi:hypothetical protein
MELKFSRRTYKKAIKRALRKEWHYYVGTGRGFSPITKLHRASQTLDSLRLRAYIRYGRNY